MPVTEVADAPVFGLNLGGTGFVDGAVVSFNGTPLATTFGSDTSISAQCDIAGIPAGSYDVVVTNPDAQVSNAQAFTITAAVAAPTVASVVPDTAVVGSADFTMQVQGSGFVSGSVVNFWGADQVTTFVDSSQLTAAIGMLGVPEGTYPVTVTNPDAQVSNSQTFTITAAAARSKKK